MCAARLRRDSLNRDISRIRPTLSAWALRARPFCRARPLLNRSKPDGVSPTGVSSDLTIVFREMSGVGAGRRLLVATVPTQTLESIEKSFEGVGVRIGLLLPASLALFEGFSATLSARARGDYALIHRAPGSFVFLVAKDGAPIFFRQRPSDAAGHDHEQEIRLSLSYYAEKLGGKGLAAAFAHDETPSESRLADAFPVPVEPLSGRFFGADASFDQLVGARPELLAAFAAACAN